MSDRVVIGKREQISIVELELYDLDAKVDTGADSSALHCDDIVIDESEKKVSFTLLDAVHEAYHGKRITYPLHTIKKVKSSNGQVQQRAAISVSVEFLGQRYESIITLTNRKDMKFPMLIGRKFLEGRFLVDVAQEYLSRNVTKGSK
jgi:hypothetical protein